MLVGKTLCTVSGVAGLLAGNLLLLFAIIGVDLVIGALFRALSLLLSLLTSILLDLILLCLGFVNLSTDTSVGYWLIRSTFCKMVMSVSSRLYI